eukprot:5821869-Pyramimonas_sp.AAC.1
MKSWAGAEVPTGVEVLLGATLWRAASTTIKSWPGLYDKLSEAATENLPMVATVQGHWSAPCWATALSMAQRLHDAQNGTAFPRDKGS